MDVSSFGQRFHELGDDALPVTALVLNDIGRVVLPTSEPLAVDEYVSCQRTGAFLIIDPDDRATLAAAMVGAPLPVLAA